MKWNDLYIPGFEPAPKKCNKVFNTAFEVSLRIILLTSSASDKYFSSTRILALDFISCYAKTFKLSTENLHGDNDFMYGEIAGRQSLVAEAIKKLVRQNILKVRIEQGYQYKITSYGMQLSEKFLSTYAREYRKVAKLSIKRYDCKDDEELMSEILNRPIAGLKE